MAFFNVLDYFHYTDLNDNVPGIRMFVTNRTAGKTTSFLRFILAEAIRDRQFVLAYRKQGDLAKSSKIFEDVLSIFEEFSNIIEVIDKAGVTKGTREYYAKIKRDDENIELKKIGFCIWLEEADNIKKYSSIFRKVAHYGMDEFQIESGKYLKKEISLFQSLYQTISRGGGERSRKVDVTLLSNDISLINPYYLHWRIPERLKPGTRKLRGDGWILFYELNLEARKAIEDNIVNSAFKDSLYSKYSRGYGQLINSNTFVEKLSGKAIYLCTLYYEGKSYGIRNFVGQNLIYISRGIEPSCKLKFVLSDSEIEMNKYLLKRNSDIWKGIRQAYDANRIRYQSVECKNVMFEMLGVDILN